MKKYILLFFTIILVVTMTACGSSEKEYEIAEAGTWSDGTYTQTAVGKNGTFEVTVTILNGNISAIAVGEHEETPDRGGVAIDQLPMKMVSEQTYQVDAVSGATVTSNALKEAVAGCLEQASK